MISQIEKHLSKYIELTPEELNRFSSILLHKKLRKRQYLIQEGDYVTHEYYVIKGCLKAYEIDNLGDEHIVQFAIEDWWISDFKAFFKEEKARLNIECIEDSELIGISKSDLEQLFLDVPKFDRFFRIKLTNAFVALQDRILSSLEKTSAERYIEFRKTYPNIEQRVPNYLIANYLGIKPESLSRLRKQLAHS
ncbi:Crp/Fnr family transcriptional regulator [Aquimarina gracilis]|uniref:Crp/Fnr family transcriptional regulator n=1 Tax=Aquimarina gracilis TaxID=874422 RepID=A0ABU5ZXZ0_9FLAO|nr:Crp/Fnr family transcriptional regulator [Aquimarina gracilis]MEB3346763.1 Crp/Fnr family transcriptional regulator [Aquimarina gracilis]